MMREQKNLPTLPGGLTGSGFMAAQAKNIDCSDSRMSELKNDWRQFLVIGRNHLMDLIPVNERSDCHSVDKRSKRHRLKKQTEAQSGKIVLLQSFGDSLKIPVDNSPIHSFCILSS